MSKLVGPFRFFVQETFAHFIPSADSRTEQMSRFRFKQKRCRQLPLKVEFETENVLNQ